MYYLQGQTMETIARHLQISRSSVSRLLAHAREVGLVRISVSASPGLKGTLAGQIADLFGVQVSVVPVHDVHTEVNRLHNVALVAAEHLIDMLFPGVTLGIAWGNTTAEVTRAMPHVSVAGSTVVQLNGAATATESGMPYAEAIIARAVDVSTTPSHYMSAYIRAAARGVDLPGAIIPTGYNRTFEAYAQATQRQRQDDGKIRFITISRLVKEKRLDVIIQAFQQAAIPHSELYIVGDGAESKRLARLAQDSPNIIFTGHVGGRKAIVQLLRDADVFVLASYRFDNQPIVIPESLVVGVPILYCDDRLDVGLNQGNSLLVQPDTASLAAGMQRIAEPTYHQQLVDGTKSVLTELSPQATATAYAQLYQQVIEQYHKR